MAGQLATAIAQDAFGQRLDRYAADLLERIAADPNVDDASAFASLSRSHVRKLIEEGHLLIDGKPARPAMKLRGGEWLTLEIPAPTPVDTLPQPELMPRVQVLHEDADVIVVNKPAGMLVHPGAGESTGTLVNALLAHCGDLSGIGGIARPGIVHRLDRGTTGVLVVAKHDGAHEALAAQFAERTLEKFYVAYVVGVPKPRQGRIETLYGRHPKDRKRFSSKVRTGKQAVTEYEVARQGDGVSRVDVRLHTGRTHQIRVHLADHGNPLLGDQVYGPRRLTRVKPGPIQHCAANLERQALHSMKLVFTHPTTGERLQIEAPLPEDLAALDVLLS